MDSDFSITIIGSNSAIAAHGRYPSAQYLKFKNEHFLIDCGEGTQFRMHDFGIPKAQISKIFISHLHGDHFFGLIGLLTSYSLAGRTKALDIYAPKGLQEIIELQSRLSDAYFSYQINHIETNTDGKNIIYEDERIQISSFPMIHRIPTTGFHFEEKQSELRINKDLISAHQITVDEIHILKSGKDVHRADGSVLHYLDFTIAAKKTRSYAYCSDTMYNEKIAEYVASADVLYHESTFEANLELLAYKTQHSTTTQAATLAQLAQVKTLLIGHFSSRYHKLDKLLAECQATFENTLIAEEGQTYPIE